MSLYRLARPFVFGLDAETAHGLAIAALRTGLLPRQRPPDPRLEQHLMGITFPTPVGLAAGFDKNADVTGAVLDLGFGHVEVGTVTPKPQPGNPKPRMFRLVRDRAAINRLGFNNRGFDHAAARLAAGRPRGVVGVNVGADRDSADRTADYVAGVRRFAGLADYIAINVSSPNTPGLRALQAGERLGALLRAVAQARQEAGQPVPLLVKISPDIDAEADLEAVVAAMVEHGIEGMIVANSTLARDGLSEPAACEAGGLSGRPLFRRSTALLARVRRLAGEKLVLVGVGGVDSVETAWAKLAAGADLVQLYTGMIYEGPDLAARIAEGMAARLDREGVAAIGDIVGTETDRWAKTWPSRGIRGGRPS